MGQIQDVFAKAAKAELWAGNLIAGRADSGKKLENRTPIDNSVIGHLAMAMRLTLMRLLPWHAKVLTAASGRNCRLLSARP